MKKHILLIASLIVYHLVFAQFSSDNWVGTTLLFPQSGVAADLDGDGDEDVLVGSYSNDVLAWYENLGNKSFGPQRIIDIRLNAIRQVMAVDIDGDGRLDVLTASDMDDKIAWFRNLGGGVFSKQMIITTSADQAASVYAADLDRDGDLDVMSASNLDDKIAWYENLGNGKFGLQKVVSTAADWANSVYAADIDGDTLNDILSASCLDGKIAWYKNLGGGTFASQSVIATINNARQVSAYDFDGDGNMDILSTSSGNVGWHKNLGGGKFASWVIIHATNNGNTNHGYSYAADLDSDKDLDVVSIAYDGNKVVWSENIGNGTFGPVRIIDSKLINPSSVHVGDFNGDSLKEVLVISSADNKIVYYLNQGGGMIDTVEHVIDQGSWNSGYKTAAADIDGDGLKDIVTIHDVQDKLTWYKNLGNHMFSSPIVVSSNVTGAYDLVATDLDKDHDIDLLVSCPDAHKLVWYKNLGGGIFSTEDTIASQAVGINDIHVVDLNLDQNVDILAASFSKDSVVWYKNLGSGKFSSSILISSYLDGPKGISSGDINGDGIPDVVSSSFSNKVVWFENKGNDIIDTTQHQIASLNGPSEVIISDVDKDHDDDVFVASIVSKNVYCFKNQGNGTFTGAIVALGDYPTSIQLADVDKDGDDDLFAALYNNNMVVWYENKGNANFVTTKRIISSELYTPTCVVPVDLDNDKDFDVISCSSTQNHLAWFENLFNQHTEVSGQLFFDANQNGIFDSLDQGFKKIGVRSIPASDYAFSGNDGKYKMDFNYTNGQVYTIEPQLIDYWGITTDSTSYHIQVDSNYVTFKNLDFGFYPDSIVPGLDGGIIGGFARCHTICDYWVYYKNTGTSIASGIIQVQLDDSLDFISAVPPPDSVNAQGLFWHFDNLQFFEEGRINMNVRLPGMGNALESIVNARIQDSSGKILYNFYDTTKQTVVCAFDPNGKYVTPNGAGPEGYIPNNSELEYMICFQNTGTDTAFNVIIRDQLDANLDWKSFKPVASSHPMEVSISHDGELVFTFENIQLVDSVANEPGSHGFALYRISPKSGLAPKTTLHNTAGIYFDFNSPVITNTVLNTIDTLLITDIPLYTPPADGWLVHPNPTSGLIHIVSQTKERQIEMVEVYNANGQLMKKFLSNAQNYATVDLSSAPAGIYFIKIRDTVGNQVWQKVVR